MSKEIAPIGRRTVLGGAGLSLSGSVCGGGTPAAAASENSKAKQLEDASAGKRLAFTVTEYRARVAKVQQAIATRKLDALLVYNMANICYLTGLESIAPHKYWLCLVPATGDPVLLMEDFESHNALVCSWVDDLAIYKIFEDPIAATRKLLHDRSLDAKRLGIELGPLSSLSTQNYLRLHEAVPAAKLIDASDLVPCVAAIKSSAEIAYLREAARITSAAMKSAIEAVQPGRTDNDIAAVASQRLLSEGSEYQCCQPIVTVGPRSGVPHTTFQRIHIRRGDPVFMEFGACVRRYTSPIMRTAVIGKPSEKMKKMFGLCLTSVNASLDNLKPGAAAGNVAAMSEQAMGPLPAGWVWHGYYAYSIGLGFPPEWADCGEIDVVKGSKAVLRPGMVFHCSTSIRDPGKMGTTCSETVVITERSCEVLTKLPRELFVR